MQSARIETTQQRGVSSGSDTQLLRVVLDEDVLVVADAVLDGVNHTVGHGPPAAS
jgi:hypothetical protein